MERDQAVRFLMEDCRFEKPLTESDAEAVWRKWRDRAATLPERQALAPEAVPLTASENAHAARFLQFIGALGVSGVQVVKIDPLQLVVGQYHIAIDVAAAHAARAHDDEGWMEHLLPSSPSNPKLDMNFTRRNFDTEIMIDLPHAEFIFGVHSHGGFGPKEMLGYVMAIRIGNRMMLGKGYHRLYSRISACRGSFPERLSLVALDPSTLPHRRPPTPRRPVPRLPVTASKSSEPAPPSSPISLPRVWQCLSISGESVTSCRFAPPGWRSTKHNFRFSFDCLQLFV